MRCVSREELRTANINGTLCVSHPLLSETTSFPVSDVNNYVIVRKLLESVFYILWVLLRHEGSSLVLIEDSSSILLPTHWSLDSSVGIATRYRLDGRGVGVRGPVWARFCSSPRPSYRFCGLSSLLSQWVLANLSPGEEEAAGA
jgi:hypothetical protein